MNLKQFFTMFVGDSGLSVHIRMKQADTGEITELWLDPTKYDNDSLQRSFTDKSKQDRENIWVQVSAVKEGSKTPVLSYVAWADIDVYKYPGGETQALQLLKKFPEPTVLVRSGRGLHVYWQLNEPLAAEGEESPAMLLSKSIQFQLGADPAYASNKILRVPGTYNFKPDEYDGGKECVILSSSDKTYNVSDFSTDPTLLKLGHKAAVRIVLGPEKDTEDRSSYDFGLLQECRKYGLTNAEMTHLMQNYRFSGKAHESGNHKTHYIKQTVFKATTAALPVQYKEARDSAMFVGKKLKEILAEEKPDFLVEGFLTQGGVAMVSAPPKARKSWCVMQLAHAVSTGTKWLGFDVNTPKKVAYVQAELPNWMVAERMIQLFGNVDLDNITFYHVPAADISKDDDMQGLMEAVESADAQLVIIDPVANFWQGDENSSSHVNRLFDQLAKLQKKGISVVLVHHSRKTEPNERLSPQHQRGSNVFFARPDAIMTLSPMEAPGEHYTWADFSLRASKPKEPMKLYADETGGFTIQPPTASKKGVVAERMAQLAERRKRSSIGESVSDSDDKAPWEDVLSHDFN